MLRFKEIFASITTTTSVFATLALLVGLFAMPFSAAAASDTLSPVSYTTTSGSSGGQPVANLAVQDQSGTANDWNKYVEFIGSYAGYRTYNVPSSITPSAITAIQVKANYQGPAKSTQTWTWKIYNWSTSTWVTLGDNTGAPDWGAWMLFTFDASGTMSNYISGTSQIWIQVVSNNSAEAMDLDYEAVIITSDTGPTNTPTNTPVPATATHTNTPTASVTSYEAEASGNTLAGGAVVETCSTCSSGNLVGWVGNNAGTLQFNSINAATAGNYTLTIYYINGDSGARSATLSVNGGAGTSMSYPATGSWTTVGSIQTTVALNAGSNTLKLSNPVVGSWAPDYDRLTVNTGTGPTNTPVPATATATRTNTPVASTPTNTSAPATATHTNTPTASVTSYEAEASGNTLAGGAVVETCSTCSGGNLVGWVGNNAGTLQFNSINAATAGNYTLTIYYINGDSGARSATLSVNGGAGVSMSYLSTGSWTTVGSIQTTVGLNAGANTLKFSNPVAGSWAPDYDRVTVNTGGGPTSTATNTSAPSTATPTRTNTPVPPTATRTNTPVPPTATRTNTPVGPTATPGTGSWWKPSVDTPWHWQLDDPVDFNNIHPVVMYDIDLFNTPASDVAALHALGIKVVCYFSAGSYEDGRPDSGQFTAADKGLLMEGWPENWIDTRSTNVRNIMTARIQLCKDKGFDGVEPDNIDGYSNNTGFPLTYATQLNYNRFLATTAHNLGLAIFLKNDGDQAVDLWQDFDGELNEECFNYNECDVLNTYFVQNNKPVFHVEYGTALSTFCPYTAGQLNFNSIRKPGTTVDTSFQPCP